MIDIKELRIGSHILAGGVRARVIDIHKKCLETENFPYQVFVEGFSPDDGEKKVVGGMSENLDPIPLTAELLQELGFETLAQSGSMSSWARDDIYISIVGECVSARIVNDKNDLYISSIRYLHELEVFVYLTTKQGLIKED